MPYMIWIFAAIVAIFLFVKFAVGLVIIGEAQVGIVVKKIGKPLANHRFIATAGEAGYQAGTLAPGWHLWLWAFMYDVIKQPITIIKEGEIGLVVARDGEQIPANRILGGVVECNNFQDATKFLENGGEKGRQLGLLTAGVYRINTSLFEVISTDNIEQKNLTGVTKEFLKMTQVKSDFVGLVTVLDGQPLVEGRIAGTSIPGHSSFQDGKAFISNGGFKGLQEDVLRPGSYTINPWFAKIEQIPMTEIDIGYVGVVVSSSGDSDEDVSGTEFTHSNLVKKGNRGIWAEPLFPGKHALNIKILKVEKIPTTNIVLNWGRESSSHKYDENLNSITTRTKDGFSMSLDVSQIIHVGAGMASKVIARVGSMQNLVDNILQPIIGNYFRNSCQASEALDYIKTRAERQREAAKFIKEALLDYDVEAVDTLIGDLVPPEQLMLTLTNRKIADEEKTTYASQKLAQDERKKLLEAIAMAESQAEVVKQEQGIRIANSRAQQSIEEAKGQSEKVKVQALAEAESLRVSSIAQAESVRVKAIAEAESIEKIGEARAKAYQASANALGPKNLAALEIINKLADKNIKITPDIYAGGGEAGGGMQGLIMASILSNLQDKSEIKTQNPAI
ncbi:MAG: SPFH domain-containing protein [Bacteriovorax sp.]|nr:SPFH domain-containing protein [Bacteriovorax sp.]